MRQAIIIANGRMEIPPKIGAIIQSSDLVIAADGGIHNCKMLGIQPDLIIGDLDSLGQDDFNAHQAAGINVTRYPTHKDETDLELALQFALKDKAREVIIIGALGDRWDMTIANVLLAAHPQFSEMKIRLLDGTQELVLVHPGEHLSLMKRIGDGVSLIPLRGDASGVITHGLEYSLNGETLIFGSPRGVSNNIIHERAEITFSEGLLLCVLDRRGRI